MRDKLTAKQRQAIILLATGSSLEDTATTVGVSLKTLYTWRTSVAEFQAELNAEREDVLSTLRDSLRSAGIDATEALRGLLKDGDPLVRLKAANGILSRLDPFNAEAGASVGIGSGDPKVYRGDQLTERTQRVRLDLEALSTGNMSANEFSLIHNTPKTMTIEQAQAIMEDEAKVEALAYLSLKAAA